MTHLEHFSSSAALQKYLLDETGPGSLVIVPHRRLARQVWHKQRLANLTRGRIAWEPLPLMTLPDWWRELFHTIWPPYALAPPLVRLALWRQAMDAAPPLEGSASDQEWAQALDDVHELLLRHALPLITPGPGDTPLVGRRRQVTKIYRELLREQGWLAKGEVPGYLLAALEQQGLRLPARLFVVGLKTTAPAEESWLAAVARHLPVTRLLIRGNPDHLQRGVVLPDREEEMAWVASRLLACHHEGIPLHRLAVTSPVMDRYAPRFQSFLRELLGPAVGEAGCAYNLSQGPLLADTPLMNAALLPLSFLARGERREDLMALLLSPYYQMLKPHQGRLASLDRRFREKAVDQGWRRLKAAAAREAAAIPALAGILAGLDEIWSDPGSPATGRAWGAWLQKAWQRLGFPGSLEEGEKPQFERAAALVGDFTAALGDEVLTPAGALAWLHQGIKDDVLPGPGVQEAGVQVLGWLEMRGLDFDRVFCLGMNSGSFPGAARPLPLLSRAEREQIQGGTQESQDQFALEQFDNLLGTAPHLILTRPAREDQEPQVGTPFFLKDWEEVRLSLLSQPDAAWMRVSAVQAARSHPAGGKIPGELQGTLNLPLPGELRVTQVGKALGCRCRFVLEDLLGLQDLPEIESGLDPRERGQKLHEVLAHFVKKAGHTLPPEAEALALLREAAREVLGPVVTDVHWQAEWHRWFGEGETPGLLTAWLALEQERLARGWRWLGAELAFAGLARPGWPFSLRGRLDRLDYHPEQRELMVWDYKTGAIPSGARVFDRQEEFQLPGYLWAVREGRTPVDLEEVEVLCAGFIGLKSCREDHLKHQDFSGKKDCWAEVLESWEEEVRRLGERLAAGDVRPAPRPAPARRDEGACRFCKLDLICGINRQTGGDEADEGEP
jgi:ATP-dependent helicase/nuclease subunit B